MGVYVLMLFVVCDNYELVKRLWFSGNWFDFGITYRFLLIGGTDEDCYFIRLDLPLATVEYPKLLFVKYIFYEFILVVSV